MQFIHQSLTWGFLLALLPLAIHLINLVRRRRVRWAAMEFLLQSYRKHRTWIWLQQLLLLLLRMAAVALIVAMLAQWVTQREWFALFGGTATHHFVLIDDSYSMSERVSGSTAFDLAEQSLGNIAARAMEQETRQKLTVLRFSRGAIGSGLPDVQPASGSIADLSGEIVDAAFDARIAEIRRQLEVTQLAAGPQGALRVVKQLLAEGRDESNVVYLLSDFRDKEWANPAELQQLLREISDADGAIHFVDCATRPQPNLSIEEIRPAEETRAAGVPLFVDISVRNNGPRPERKIPVRVRTHYYDPQVVAASRPGEEVARRDEPPAVLIDEIPPGEVVTARSQVYFPLPGPHVVEARLPEDSVEADNRRWCVVDLPESEPVLVIDGSPSRQHAYYALAAFAPGQRAATGVRPVEKPVAFLRDVKPEELRGYRAVYLFDVPRLDNRALTSLTDYVRGGGGLGVFLGENVNIAFYNEQFFDGGRGLFPLPLGRQDSLANEYLENAPDFEVFDNPIFNVFRGDRNPLINWVRMERYVRPEDGWDARSDSENLGSETASAEVLARLRNGDPLAVARPFGDGRVVTFLTTAAPLWNNWANDPSFVVVLLKLHSFLAAPSRRSESRFVGDPLTLRVSRDSIRPQVNFVAPGPPGGGTLVIGKAATEASPEAATLVATLGRGGDDDTTAWSGIYEAWLGEVAGGSTVRRFAINVQPDEGALGKATAATLLERLPEVDLRYHDADEYAFEFIQNASANRSLLLMCLVIAVLLGEQTLAYFTSFHPARGTSR